MHNVIRYSKLRWFVLLTIVTGYISNGIFQIATNAVLENISREFSISVGQVSIAFYGTYIFSAAVSTIISGPLIDRFKATPVIIAGTLVICISGLSALVLGYCFPGAIATRVLAGLGAGPMTACVSAVAVRWFPMRERGIFAGFLSAAGALGIALGFNGMVYALHFTDRWQNGMAVLAVVPFIAFILCIITGFFKEPAADIPAESISGELTGSSFKKAYHSLPFYMGIISMFAFMWVLSSFNDLTSGYISLPGIGLGLSAAFAGKCISFIQIGMIVGSIACGFILEKIFKGRIKPVLMTAFFCLAVFVLSVRAGFVYRNHGLLLSNFFFTGFFEGFIIPMIAAFVAINYPKEIVGRVFGLFFGIGIFGGTAGIFAGSTLLNCTGNYTASVILIGAVAFTGFISSMCMTSASHQSIGK